MDYHWELMAAIYISFSILTIISNLIIISVILYSPVLRKKHRNCVILSIALADLLFGSFVLPLYATSLITKSHLNCHTKLAVQVTGDHGIFFVVGWELVTFNLLHFHENREPQSWTLLGLRASTCFKSLLLAVWPWFAALCVLVPLIQTYTSTKHMDHQYEDIMCILKLTRSVLITVCFFSLYLPFCLCVASLVAKFLVGTCKRFQVESRTQSLESPATLMENFRVNPHDEAAGQLSPQPSSAASESSLVASIPNAVYLICYAPVLAVTWMELNEMFVSFSVTGVVVFGVLARSVLLPLSWVVFSDIRHEMKEYQTKLKGVFSLGFRNPLPASSSSVSFSRLQVTCRDSRDSGQ